MARRRMFRGRARASVEVQQANGDGSGGGSGDELRARAPANMDFIARVCRRRRRRAAHTFILFAFTFCTFADARVQSSRQCFFFFAACNFRF